MRLLDGVVRPYAWGSRTAIAALRGMPTPSAHPEAELWFGAHPAAPAIVRDDARENTLLEVIDADPRAELGTLCAERYDGRLPFLMKILAAEEPLSLQAHPSLQQAKEGFARENERGIDVGAPDRNYRDENHKPELVVALSEFHALAGFRDVRETVDLLRVLQVPELDSHLGMIAGQPDSQGLRALFTTWITSPESALSTLIPAVLAGAIRYLESGQDRFAAEARTVLEIGENYPLDPGVLAVLLLNRVTLAPGEGLYLPAGNLHAYLWGTAVEVMANSDNVLRGGLTPKHVDVPELLRVLDFNPVAPDDIAPSIHTLNSELIYQTPAAEFRLSKVELDGTGLRRPSSILFDVPGPQILLCTTGSIELRGPSGHLVVPQGRAAWLGDNDPDVIVHAASAHTTFFRGLVPGH
ncbi:MULTISPECIES: mannose-6-phosphate isomerase, class I [Actinomycetes]|jgi:mannose-6-phosphate isomerase|uniref:mannose-6-phosphate isomerase n=1 Tax=Williamsia marianensis TaxID=85044 RepID=A0ABU4F0H5_WILMA|nr:MULTISPECIES: mannose-6-phosphate isomerase, class I [Actinomycetes]MDV7137002.1 mannose-6-phosphate isomerase, class I [Williamsia muralis]PVY34131.1 mannose-6-phosphate isomerase type 1 [Williamsia marianensis]